MEERKDQHEQLSADELREVWAALSEDERVEGFLVLPREDAEDLFTSLAPLAQGQLLGAIPPGPQQTHQQHLAQQVTVVEVLHLQRGIGGTLAAVGEAHQPRLLLLPFTREHVVDLTGEQLSGASEA